MSGSRDSGERLTDALRLKILDLVSQMRRSCHVREWDARIPAGLTVFSTDFRCHSRFLSLKTSAPLTHDGFRGYQPKLPQVSWDPLVSPQVTVQGSKSCQLVAATYPEPVFWHYVVPLHQISFENLTLRRISGLSIQPFKAKSCLWPPAEKPKLSAYSIAPVHYKTRPATKPVQTFTGRSKSCPPKLFGLPLIKTPSPLHRFPLRLKDRFRRALAEKAGAAPNKVLVNRVYERISMGYYRSISQDERGVLVCFPKPEAVGRMRQAMRNQDVSYLVFGETLDTKEAVSTLVPMAEVSTDD